MLRVAITEQSRNGPDYQVLLMGENDTVMDILTHKKLNPATNNIFVNGKLVRGESLAMMLRTFRNGENMIFVTVKYKTIDRPRRASPK